MSWKSFFNTCWALPVVLVLAGTILVAQGCSDARKGRRLIAVGTTAPGFSLELFDGTTWTLQAYRGTPVIISFMASWCPCSNESVPFLEEAYRRYHPSGTEFLLIGIQDSAENFREFLRERGVSIPAGYDTDGSISTLYGVDAPPVTVFVDGEQKVKRVYFGNIKEVGQLYYDWIEEVLR